MTDMLRGRIYRAHLTHIGDDKFFLVVSWFMHLRTDSKILRRLFLIGLIAAPIVYTIMLLVLRVFAH